MNIFVSDPSARISAEALDDKRLIKMILESAQLMSTCMHVLGIPDAPYKATHINHPCSVWVRQNKSNYVWLFDHFYYLLDEYTKRYGKIHKCEQYKNVFGNTWMKMPKGDITPFVNCTNFKHIPDVHEAYRAALIDKWKNDKRAPKWTNSQPPHWISDLILK